MVSFWLSSADNEDLSLDLGRCGLLRCCFGGCVWESLVRLTFWALGGRWLFFEFKSWREFPFAGVPSLEDCWLWSAEFCFWFFSRGLCCWLLFCSFFWWRYWSLLCWLFCWLFFWLFSSFCFWFEILFAVLFLVSCSLFCVWGCRLFWLNLRSL